MKDLRVKYKNTGHDYHPHRHWQRRWARDLRLLTEVDINNRIAALEAAHPTYATAPAELAREHANLVMALR